MSRRGNFLFALFVLIAFFQVVGLAVTKAYVDPEAVNRVNAMQAKPQSEKPPLSPIEALQAFVKDQHIESGSKLFAGAHYVGADACASCHAAEHKEWQSTWHAKMEQWPTKETVIGEFDGQRVTYRDIKVTSADGKRSEKVTFDVIPFQKDGGYFFTVVDRDNAENNQTFKVAKTLGGKWDQGYEIEIGKNYYPAILRYSNTGGGWLVQSFMPELWIEPDGTPDGRPRSAAELPKHRVAEAKCAGCHTTGFTYSKDDKGVWQASGDGQLGIGCEKCHGPASKHIDAAKAASASGRKLARGEMHIVHTLRDLDHNQQNQLCAQCHGRSSNRQHKEIAFPLDYLPGNLDIVEKLAFWNYQSTTSASQTKYFYRNNWAKRNRQQWQDHNLSAHNTKAGLSCLTCHTFHGKWENMQLRAKPQELCTSCHTAADHAARPQTEMFADSKMQQAGVQCIDCHMARIGFRSHVTTKTANKKDYPMDGSSHHYLVPTPAIKKAYGVRTACEVCHQKDRAMPPWIEPWVVQNPMDDDRLDARMTAIRSETRALIKKVQSALQAVEASKPGPERRMAARMARANLDFILLDGSLGLHNPGKARDMLKEALTLLAPGEKQASAGSVNVLQSAAANTAGPVSVDGPASETPTPGHWYVSRTGDTLGALAELLYGRASMADKIFAANKVRLLDGPDVVVPGTKIFLPREEPTKSANGAEAK